MDGDLAAGATGHRRQQLSGNALGSRLIAQHVVRVDHGQDVGDISMAGEGFECPREHGDAPEIGVLLGHGGGAARAAPPPCGNDDHYG